MTGKQTAALLFVLLALACGRAPLSGGSGSEGEARVRGCVVYQGSALPAVNAEVRLRSDSFLMDTSSTGSRADAVTDSFGRFLLDSVDTGGCSIEINDGNGHAVLIRCHVVSDTTLPVSTLMPTGTIGGTWETFVTPQAGYFVQIYGLDRIARVDPLLKTFTISDVPAGIFTLHFITSSPGNPLRTFNNIQLASGQELSLALSPWSSSKRLYLNTTASGAGVSGDILGFPVLVRLTGSTFDFTAAQPDGHDIRFLRADRTLLPYEIERWDAVNQQAEIWVKVDTVFGNDSAQFIVMYWGNTDAADSSNGAAVFDTSNGFLGVWHMNEDPSAGTGSIKDRTAYAHDATPYGSITTANSVDGAVGKALSFDGKDDYLNAGNVSVPGTYSIGLWVLLDTLGDYQRFITKDSSYTLWYDKDSVSVRMEHMPAGSWWRGLLQDGGTRVPMTTGAWYYFVGTFDGAAVRLYANGAEASVSGPISAIPRTNSKPVILGQSTGHSFVNGMMDEIRIEGVARSADWIRLCYMNQRVDDKLVIFK